MCLEPWGNSWGMCFLITDGIGPALAQFEPESIGLEAKTGLPAEPRALQECKRKKIHRAS